MSIDKASSQVLVDMAIKGMMPRMTQLILASDAYQTVRKLFAEADTYAAEVDQQIDALQAEARKRYVAAQQAMAALLSEQGLQAVVDDLKDARASLDKEG